MFLVQQNPVHVKRHVSAHSAILRLYIKKCKKPVKEIINCIQNSTLLGLP